MSDLYPSFDMPDIVGATENTVVAFPKSWLWDWDICDFVQTGSGDVVEVDGLTAWAQWCVKAILTQRLAFVVYDWNYGADIESCLKQPTRAVTEAELEREITETLLTDPRTAEVKNFRFEWSGDELTVWFTVVNALGQPAEVQVGVGYREVQRQFSLSRVEQYVSDWLRGELVNVEPTENGELVIKSVAQPTFTRDSIAYKSDGSQVAANQPRFEQGQFGKAVMVEEGTTNLFPTNLALSFSSAWTSLTLNGTYTVSIKGGTGSLVLSGGASGTVNVGSSLTFTVSNATVTFTPSGGTPAYCQLEQKPYATSFIDGTRSAETLTIPTAGVLNPQEGTVEFTVIPSYNWNANLGRLAGYFGCKGSAYNKSRILVHKDGNYLRCMFQNTDTTVVADIAKNISGFSNKDPLYLAASWKPGRIAFLVNGSLVGEVATTWNVTEAFTACYIGSGERGTVQSNSLIDDPRISNRARTDEEILAAYQSGQPLPVDEWTTYLLRFDNNLKVGRGGYRLSKPIYLKSLGTCNGSNISWEANIPAGCDVKVYASVDGSTFQECENNAPIPSLSEGVSLVDKVLTVKEVLLTEDGVNRPELMVVRYNVDGTVTLRG